MNQIIQIRQESYKNGIIDKEQVLHVVKKKKKKHYKMKAIAGNYIKLCR